MGVTGSYLREKGGGGAEFYSLCLLLSLSFLLRRGAASTFLLLLGFSLASSWNEVASGIDLLSLLFVPVVLIA